MDNPLTTLTLILLTLLSLAAWAAAIARLRLAARPADPQRPHHAAGDHDAPAAAWANRIQRVLVGLIGVGCTALFVERWIVVHQQWQPLGAHIDGLLLIAALFAGAILFIQARPKLFGLSAFGLPLLTLILTWAICASAWTYHPFHLPPRHLWMAVHLGCVYLGTLSSAIAAIAGGMYLYVQSRLKRKHALAGLGRLASLEALETLIIRCATLGFTLLTVGLASGAIILTDPQALPGGAADAWFIGKIALAATAWLIYALLMNVRYATRFRGARAAWLSIAGLTLLLATYAVMTSLPAAVAPAGPATRPGPPAALADGETP